jgi:hypothetical protein
MKKLLLTTALTLALSQGAAAQTKEINYYAAAIGLATAATATDVYCLQGAPNIVTRVHSVGVYSQSAANGTVLAGLVKRSSFDSGGTLATGLSLPTPVHDSSQSAPQDQALAWTTSPATLGTYVGALDATRWNLATNGSNPNNVGSVQMTFPFPVVLRGAEALCVTFTGSGLALTSDIDMWWSEGTN